MADSTTDYNNLDPLGDEAAVVDKVDAVVSGARKKPRAVDMVPKIRRKIVFFKGR